MKKLRYVLLIIIALFGFNANALRISHYEPTFEMDEEFNNDQVVFYFGFRGELANQTEFKIEYDTDYLEFKGDYPGTDYKVIGSGVNTHGKKKTKSLKLVTDIPTDNVLYVGMKFEVKKKFKVGKSTEIKVFDIYSENTVDNLKYRSEGYHVRIKRDSSNTMLAMRTDINESSKRERFTYAIMPYVIIGIVFIVLVIIAILMIPSKATENRSRKVKKQLDPKYYPIPGVGPLPSMKKKTKRDVIEPEEKVIEPLADFVSKSTETNQELMNRGLEVDQDMFKDNPTKSGEQGLININPLAFDDGEDVAVENPLSNTNSNNNNSNNDDNIDTL